MSASTSRNGTSPAEIEADIERQREQLAATVDQLQVQLRAKARSTARIVAVVAGAAIVGLVGVTVWRRAHR